MATRKLVTVGPGRTYGSLDAAIDGELVANADLVSAGLQLDIQMDGFLDTTRAIVAGFTTDAEHHIRIYPARGAEARMPWSTKAYRLDGTPPGNPASMLDIQDEFVFVERLQIGSSQDGVNVGAIRFATAGCNNSAVIGCVVRMTRTDPSGLVSWGIGVASDVPGGSVHHAINCVVYDVRETTTNTCAGFYQFDNNSVFRVYGCTAYRCLHAFQNAGDVNELIVNNCIGYDSIGTDFEGTFGSLSSHNVSSDGTAPGFGSRTNQIVRFVDPALRDLHLDRYDRSSIGFGRELRNSTFPFYNDFDNQPRGSVWDIGADQVLVAKPYTRRIFTPGKMVKKHHGWTR